VGLEEFRTAQQDTRSLIDRAIESLRQKGEGQRAADLIEAVTDRSIGPLAISRVLKNWGYTVGESSVRRYREGMGG
jgi:hypothetical protein